MQTYTRGKETVEMEGRTVRRLIVALDETYPGLKDALMDGDRLKPGIAVAVNGQISHLGPPATPGRKQRGLFRPRYRRGIVSTIVVPAYAGTQFAFV